MVLTTRIRKAIKLAALVGALALTWQINTWRMSGTIESLESDLKVCETNSKGLQASIDSQNAKVDKWEAKAKERRQAAKEAKAEAAEKVKGLEAGRAKIKKARGKTCADAEALIDEGLGL